MPAALLSINPVARRAEEQAPAATRRHFELIGIGHPARPNLEAFIAAEFSRVYKAQLDHFCEVLVGCTDAQGEWIAALGFSLARNRGIFLEHYLDEPVEVAIARQAGMSVARSEIVEVGNLAATSAGAARDLIVFMTRYLYRLGLKWVTFTATRVLLNSFTRLKLAPAVLAEADPVRLPDQGKNWGSYYAGSPQVMFGNIEVGHASVAK